VVGARVVVENSVGRDSEVGDDAHVGPYAHLLAGTSVPSSTSTGAFYTAPAD
jgi:bifunctional N-acetylglucosamine-1-phosphate-uridyltransferase/glucosamine-1-phosphate-acetyltransferase GlmU-like protein